MDLNASALAMISNQEDGFCGPSKSLYASGYGYVGGCYECCSEAAMIEEIYHRGPIVVAVDVRLLVITSVLVSVRLHQICFNTAMAFSMMLITTMHACVTIQATI